jgi:hypothetical protein
MRPYGIAALPQRYRDSLPSEIVDAVDSPACAMRVSHGGSTYVVVQRRYVLFGIDIFEGPTGLAHELAHFAAVPEERCGISDFGFRWNRSQPIYTSPKTGWPAISHEAEVFARERNIADAFGFSRRSVRDEFLTLLTLPGRDNWLATHTELPETAAEALISAFMEIPGCSARATLQETTRRLALLEREPWRIRRRRLTA